MLTEHEQQEIRAQLAQFERPAAVVPEALKLVQARRGWVADDDVRDIAAFLGIDAAEIEAIATFYSLIFRKPVGRHVILLCDSVSCWIMGYRDLRTYLTERLGIGLGETTPDGRFTLLPTVCLGACELAPAMLVDGTLHGNLTPKRIDAILADYM
jgi:NADH-quinone oxidoreductase subunit E